MSAPNKFNELILDFVPAENCLYQGRNKIVEPLRFRPVQSYMQYEMHFLENPIVVYLANPVSMIKSKFNYRIFNLHGQDKGMLNNVFQHINLKLKLSVNEMYLNGKKVPIHDLQHNEISELENKEFMIGIMITGYKTSDKGFSTPVWKLNSAYTPFV